MGKEKKNHETKEGNKLGINPEVAQEEIRVLAYQLFCECGCEHGHDVEHWLEAERRILTRDQGNGEGIS